LSDPRLAFIPGMTGAVAGAAAAAAWQTAFATARTTNSPGWTGWTIVQKFSVAALGGKIGSKFRLTLVAASTGSGFSSAHVWAGHRNMAGEDIDFDGTQVRVQSGGSNTNAAAAGASLVTDAMTYAFNGATKDFLVAAYFDGVADLGEGSAANTGMWGHPSGDSGTIAATTNKTQGAFTSHTGFGLGSPTFALGIEVLVP
jgi:hypothetical protein